MLDNTSIRALVWKTNQTNKYIHLEPEHLFCSCLLLLNFLSPSYNSFLSHQIFGQFLMLLSHGDKTWIKGKEGTRASFILLSNSFFVGLLCWRQCGPLSSDAFRMKEGASTTGQCSPGRDITHQLILSTRPEHRFHDLPVTVRKVRLREAETPRLWHHYSGSARTPTQAFRTLKTILFF